jgi:hypothetical protein
MVYKISFEYDHGTWREARETAWYPSDTEVKRAIKRITSKPSPAVNIRIFKLVDVTDEFDITDNSRKENWTVEMLERTLVCHTVLQPDERGNFDRLWKAKLDCEKTMGCIMHPSREEG